MFPELLEQDTSTSKTLLEVGCGVGNAALPLLEMTSNLQIYAVDFAPTAIELFQTQPLYDEKRCTAVVHDMTEKSIPTELTHIADYALCLFCLSAIHPDKMVQAARNIAAAMKPGGQLLFRDYGRYDQAQLRFRPGHKLDENFYIRQDLTRAYYFTLEQVGEIFKQAGFIVQELEYIRRQYVNRKQGVTRFRVWIHGKFQRV